MDELLGRKIIEGGVIIECSVNQSRWTVEQGEYMLGYLQALYDTKLKLPRDLWITFLVEKRRQNAPRPRLEPYSWVNLLNAYAEMPRQLLAKIMADWFGDPLTEHWVSQAHLAQKFLAQTMNDRKE